MQIIKIKVTETEVTITRKPKKLTSGNIEFIKCEFDLSEAFDNLVVRAVFNGEYRTVENGMCYAPELAEGPCEVGVYGYTVQENGEYDLCISPSPTNFYVSQGSRKKTDAAGNNPAPSELESHYALIKQLIDKGSGNSSDLTGTTDYRELLNTPRELFIPPDNKDAVDNPFGDAPVVYMKDIPLVENDRGTPNCIFDIAEDFYLLGDENWAENGKMLYIHKGDILAIEYQGSTDGWSYIVLFDMYGVFAFTSNMDNWEYGMLPNISAILEFMEEPLNEIQTIETAVGNLNESFNENKKSLTLLIESLQSKTEQKFTTLNNRVSAIEETLSSLTNANEVSY